MKKFYASILATCTALAASAATPTMVPVNFTHVGTAELNSELTLSKHNNEQQAKLAGSKAKKAVAKAHESDTWENVGEGTFHEGIVSPVYGLSTAPQYKVTVEKSTTTDGLYRVLKPYEGFAKTYSSAFSYDDTKAEPLYIQVVNGNKFYIEACNTGMTDIDPKEGGEVTIASQAADLIAGNGLSTVMSVVPEVFGDFKDGVFSYASPTFSLSGKTYYSLLVGIGDTSAGYYRGNGNNGFKLVLPGATATDYTIAVKHASCADANTFAFNVTLGSDVEKYKLLITPGEFSASASNLGVVVENGQEFTKAQTSIQFKAPATAEDGVYTILCATVDANGALKEGARGLFYVINDNAEHWTALEGKAKYTDDFVASIYQKHDDNERDVTIEESNGTSGYYRLVNPYAAPYAFASASEHSCTHNHYLYINATDPNKVYVEESPIGFEYSDGAMVASSYAYMALSAGETPEDTDWGKLEDNTITFPAESLLARELNYENGKWYLANTNNAFKVVLPKNSSVGSIAVDNNDNAPVEYFNLQGQKVDNPAAGQLVIKRQGSSVSKVLVR